MDENETKRAAVILNKIFNLKSASFSEETLRFGDEPQGVDVTSFFYNLQHHTKKLICQSIPKS